MLVPGGVDHDQTISDILLMEEIPNNHLGCICKQWDKLLINWCRISSMNSMITLEHTSNDLKWTLDTDVFFQWKFALIQTSSEWFVGCWVPLHLTFLHGFRTWAIRCQSRFVVCRCLRDVCFILVFQSHRNQPEVFLRAWNGLGSRQWRCWL